jgi:hypothetical protein
LRRRLRDERRREWVGEEGRERKGRRTTSPMEFGAEGKKEGEGR